MRIKHFWWTVHGHLWHTVVAAWYPWQYAHCKPQLWPCVLLYHCCCRLHHSQSISPSFYVLTENSYLRVQYHLLLLPLVTSQPVYLPFLWCTDRKQFSQGSVSFTTATIGYIIASLFSLPSMHRWKTVLSGFSTIYHCYHWLHHSQSISPSFNALTENSSLRVQYHLPLLPLVTS